MYHCWSLKYGRIGARLHRLFEDVIAIWAICHFLLHPDPSLNLSWYNGMIQADTIEHRMGEKLDLSAPTFWLSLTVHFNGASCCSTLWRSNELHGDGLQMCVPTHRKTKQSVVSNPFPTWRNGSYTLNELTAFWCVWRHRDTSSLPLIHVGGLSVSVMNELWQQSLLAN